MPIKKERGKKEKRKRKSGVCTDKLVLVIIICRQGAAGKGQRLDHERKGIRESRAVPAPDANAELVLSMQVTWAVSKYWVMYVLLQGTNAIIHPNYFPINSLPVTSNIAKNLGCMCIERF